MRAPSQPGVLLALAFALFPASPAAAQTEPTPEAPPEGERSPDPEEDEALQTHVRLGRAYYESGRFARAAEEYQAAYEKSEEPDHLYRLFLALRDAGRLAEAIDALEEYLRRVPDAPDRDRLRLRLANMKRLEKQRDRGEEPAQESPPQEDSGEQEPEEPEPEPTDPGDDDAPAEDREMSRKWSVLPWAVMGVGAGLLAGATATGVLALRQESDLESECDDNVCRPGLQGDIDRGKALATTTDVLLISGLAAVGAGIALRFMLDEEMTERVPTEPDSPTTVSGGCGLRGCSGEVRVRF
ncbi:MAG: tetratricopeptide repeat protein [Myxococcota bacterium]